MDNTQIKVFKMIDWSIRSNDLPERKYILANWKCWNLSLLVAIGFWGHWFVASRYLHEKVTWNQHQQSLEKMIWLFCPWGVIPITESGLRLFEIKLIRTWPGSDDRRILGKSRGISPILANLNVWLLWLHKYVGVSYASPEINANRVLNIAELGHGPDQRTFHKEHD